MTRIEGADSRPRLKLSSRATYAIGAAGILTAVGLTWLLTVFPIPYRQLGEYGYLGVFIVTLLSTAAVVVPVPYIAAIIAAGSYLDPLIVALVGGVAAALGELTGYAGGLAGRALVPDTRWTRGLEQAMRRYGAVVVFAAAVIPNPFFDAVGLMAGVTKTPLWAFLGACFLGKGIRFWALAALGAPLLGPG